MTIPLVDLRAQYNSIRKNIDDAIASVIGDTAFISGPYVKRFEDEFAAYSGVDHMIGVSNGTDAIRLALLACGVREGDEVITVPNTFIATAEAISMVGARPVFVDIDAKTHTMDPALVEHVISSRTAAIMPVHLYGRPADMDPIMAIARKHSLRVIGDAAQAHGAQYRGKPIAAVGDVVTFSFYPGKNLGAFGDAGAVATNDIAIATAIRKLRDHGRMRKYEHDIIGFNCRMDGLQGAILSAKLPHLDGWTERRIAIARRYDESLGEIPTITTPVRVRSGDRAVYHLYVIETDDRAKLQKTLQDNGVSTGIHYPLPLHLQPAYRHLGYERGSFPIAEAAAQRVLSIPIYAELAPSDVTRIAELIAATAGVHS